MQVLKKLQDAQKDESGVRLEERQNLSIQRKRQTHSQLSNHQPTELNSNFTQVSSNTKQRVTQSSSSPPHYAHGLAVNSTGQSAAGIAAGGPADGQ